jgi:hypothetical protein
MKASLTAFVYRSKRQEFAFSNKIWFNNQYTYGGVVQKWMPEAQVQLTFNKMGFQVQPLETRPENVATTRGCLRGFPAPLGPVKPIAGRRPPGKPTVAEATLSNILML